MILREPPEERREEFLTEGLYFSETDERLSIRR